MGETKISYCFTTCHGVDYSIDFVDDDLIESDASYQLIIANICILCCLLRYKMRMAL